MAPHIDPRTHQNSIFHSCFPTTFSNRIPLHPPHPRITKYCLNEQTINFPPLFTTFQTSFRIFNQPTTRPQASKSSASHLSTHSPTALTPKNRTIFPSKTQPFENCTPKALFHNLFHQNQPSLISPPENRQSPPRRICYHPPHNPRYNMCKNSNSPIATAQPMPSLIWTHRVTEGVFEVNLLSTDSSTQWTPKSICAPGKWPCPEPRKGRAEHPGPCRARWRLRGERGTGHSMASALR